MKRRNKMFLTCVCIFLVGFVVGLGTGWIISHFSKKSKDKLDDKLVICELGSRDELKRYPKINDREE